jgi:hypothetical protein
VLQKLEGAAAGEVFLAGGTVVSCLEEHGLVHIQVGQEVLQVVLDNLPDKTYIFIQKILQIRRQFYNLQLLVPSATNFLNVQTINNKFYTQKNI